MTAEFPRIPADKPLSYGIGAFLCDTKASKRYLKGVVLVWLFG